MLLCRYCNYDLDDGDIYEKLSKDVLYKYHTKEDLLKVAQRYGWSEENKLRFTKEVIIQFKTKQNLKVCLKCNGIWPLDYNMPMEYYKY